LIEGRLGVTHVSARLCVSEMRSLIESLEHFQQILSEVGNASYKPPCAYNVFSTAERLEQVTPAPERRQRQPGESFNIVDIKHAVLDTWLTVLQRINRVLEKFSLERDCLLYSVNTLKQKLCPIQNYIQAAVTLLKPLLAKYKETAQKEEQAISAGIESYQF